MKLTPHFTLQEMTFSDTATRHGLDNSPPAPVIENLRRLCELLEKVRAELGQPLRINSGFRSPDVNRLIGGAKNSQHRLGCAADFVVQGMSVRDIMSALVDAPHIDYDQLIMEFGSWVHVSIPNSATTQPRRQALIIDRKGVRPFSME